MEQQAERRLPDVKSATLLFLSQKETDSSRACCEAVTCIWNSLFLLSVGKAIIYMTIQMNVLCDIQPLPEWLTAFRVSGVCVIWSALSKCLPAHMRV